MIGSREDFHDPAKRTDLTGASTQVGFFHHRIGEEILGRVRRHDGAGLQHIAPVGSKGFLSPRKPWSGGSPLTRLGGA